MENKIAKAAHTYTHTHTNWLIQKKAKKLCKSRKPNVDRKEVLDGKYEVKYIFINTFDKNEQNTSN